jgi:hypothetical protein
MNSYADIQVPPSKLGMYRLRGASKLFVSVQEAVLSSFIPPFSIFVLLSSFYFELSKLHEAHGG